MKPETKIVPVDQVEPSHSPPPEGMVPPKIPPSIFLIVSTVIGVALIVSAITNYYNIAS